MIVMMMAERERERESVKKIRDRLECVWIMNGEKEEDDDDDNSV
jgi:hypothetical protein